jgi:tetratricopeptide (TPR) repeat protein
MIPGDAESESPHEEAHLVAQQVLGPCYHTALHEGLAMVVSLRPGSDAGLSVYAAALVEQDVVPSIGELLDEEGVRELNRRGLGFPAAGLLVQWILAAGGQEVLKRVYTAKPLTEEQLAQALGIGIHEANGAFEGFIRAQAEKGVKDLEFQQARAEATRRGSNGDWAGAIERFTRAATLRPEHLDTLYRLALAQIRAEEFEGAESTLRGLLEVASRAVDAPDRYLIFGHYQLGQVLELTGRPEQAREQYRTVLELPDRHDSHRMARESLDAGAE